MDGTYMNVRDQMKITQRLNYATEFKSIKMEALMERDKRRACSKTNEF
jgi:hypothetical protein